MCDEAFSVDFKRELCPRKAQPQNVCKLYVFIKKSPSNGAFCSFAT